MLHILADDFSAFPFEEEIGAAIRAHRSAILLVPEQLALATERLVAERFSADAPLYFEVSNFSRLADRVFRTEGGISYRYADRAAEIILMWKTLDAAAPFLSSHKMGAADTVKEGLAALAEVVSAGLCAKTLTNAARALDDGTSLKAKLSDLALLTEIFEGERDEIYGSLSADLDKLLSILKEKPLLSDTEIYVSHFTSFTAKEQMVLGEIMRHGHLSVSLPLPTEGENALCYEEVLFTKNALCDVAARVGAEISPIKRTVRPRPPMLAYAKEMLFRADGDKTPYAGQYDDSLSFVMATDPYSAATQIASRIAAGVRMGARYRDFAVLTRAPEKYDGILDEALLAEGIPVYFSKETGMTELALIKMILSAYACLERGFARTDLIAYMKCGFSGLARDDADLFELYADTWKLKGRAFSEDTPFDMHPDGYKTTLSPQAQATLARLNAVRMHLLPPLWEFSRATKNADSARAHATALYRFLEAIDAENTLRAHAKEAEKQGRATEHVRLSRLFPVLCDLLDRVVEIMGELPLTRARFAELLTLLFSSVSLDSIPTRSDTVTVWNADTYRTTGEKTLFLLGAVEGEFPAAVGLGGVFSEEERKELAKISVSVGKAPELRASREQISFLRGLAAPMEAVVVCFESNTLGSALSPSRPYHRLTQLFPNAHIAHGVGEAYSPRAAEEQFFENRDNALGKALLSLLSERDEVSFTLKHASTELFDPECTVSEQTAAHYFPDAIRTSQTAIDRFLDCPFSYYCHYALQLKEYEEAAIRPLEVGNIVHDILEKFFLYLQNDKTDIRHMDPQSIPLYVERAVKEYAEKLLPTAKAASARLSHLLSRLRRAAELVCRDLYDEFAATAFTPAFCELGLEDRDGPGALVFRDKDGKTVSIGGRIDRVDIYLSEQNKLFVRVVDYKTGGRAFSKDDLKKGRNLQMFVYLCAIWKTKCDAFLERLPKDSEEILPAGIVYSTANPKAVSLSVPNDENGFQKTLRQKHLKRNGFFLAEEDVLRAMDDRLPHMAYKADKTGSYKTDNKKLFGSLVEFGEMLDDAEHAVLSSARRMRAGCADIAPDKDADKCGDCPYRVVCRIEGVKEKNY